MYSSRNIHAQIATNNQGENPEERKGGKPVIVKGYVVYNPTYANHPKLMNPGKKWTPERLQEYAQTKRQIKDNFVKAFKGFVGCEEINVYCRPSYAELRELFDEKLTSFALSDKGKKKLILFAFAGHGGTFNGTTQALLDSSTQNTFPMEV